MGDNSMNVLLSLLEICHGLFHLLTKQHGKGYYVSYVQCNLLLKLTLPTLSNLEQIEWLEFIIYH